jgi:hypothetical protein
VRINTPTKTREETREKPVSDKKGEDEGNKRGNKFRAEREKCRKENEVLQKEEKYKNIRS